MNPFGVPCRTRGSGFHAHSCLLTPKKPPAVTVHCSFLLSRRQIVLLAGVGLPSATILPISSARSSSSPGGFRLVAAPGRMTVAGEDRPKVELLAYHGTARGRPIRLRQGKPVRIAVENQRNQETTDHWHGIRLPNAMGGVPGLTKPPIKSGTTFPYEFTPRSRICGRAEQGDVHESDGYRSPASG